MIAYLTYVAGDILVWIAKLGVAVAHQVVGKWLDKFEE